MSCSRGSIRNPSSGRCKSVKAFTLDELKKIARSYKISTSGTKAELSKRILAHFMKKMARTSTSSSAKKSYTRSRRSSSKKRAAPKRRPGRPRKSVTRSSSKKRAAPKRKVGRPRKTYSRSGSASAYYRSLSPKVVVTRRGPYRVRTSRYPTKGTGSFQARHHKPTRKGPSLPAQSHGYETARGNDGNMWRSVPDKNGVFHWKRI